MTIARPNSDAVVLQKLTDHKPDSKTAQEQYPWEKKQGHFDNIKTQIKVHGYHHTAFRRKKKNKHGSSDVRNNSTWIEIDNSNIKPAFLNRSNQLTVAFSQCMRFLVNNEQIPKYNIYENNLHSKEITDAGFLYDYVAYEDQFQCVEGLGSVLFARYLLLDDDVHLTNFFVKNNVAYGYDFDWGFSPVVMQFHVNLHVVKEHYNPYHGYYDIQTERVKPALPMFNANDFDGFPLLKNARPNVYEIGESRFRKYCLSYVNSVLCYYDVSMTNFKALIGRPCLERIIKLGVQDKNDQAAALNILKVQIDASLQACKKSVKFVKFLNHVNANRISAMSAILFEVSEFYKENRKYFNKADKSANIKEWNDCIDSIFSECDNVFKIYDMKPLQADEMVKLKDFANKAYLNDVDAIKSVIHYYQSNQRNIYIKIVNDRVIKIEEENKRNKVVSSMDEKPVHAPAAMKK